MPNTKRVNLNTASLEELESVSGIGPTTAQRIVDWRANRPFETWKDVLEVAGIGPSKLDVIRPHIAIGDGEATAQAEPSTTTPSQPPEAEHPALDIDDFDALLVREFLREPELVERFRVESTMADAEGLSRDDRRAIHDCFGADGLATLPHAAASWLLDHVRNHIAASSVVDDLAEEASNAGSAEHIYRVNYQKALCHALVGQHDEAFTSLRKAASVNDRWARHHHIYGLIHARRHKMNQACFELGMAMAGEPYRETRARIEQAVGRIEQ